MKALTLWQPWATVMANGAKTIETRPVTAHWARKYRGPLLIHAAKNWNRDVLEALTSANRHPCLDDDWSKMIEAIRKTGYGTLGELPCGAILCSICVHSVGTILLAEDYAGGSRVMLPDGAFVEVDENEQAFGDYREGRLGIVSSHVTRFASPIPYRGQQGLFDVPDDVVREAIGE